MAGCPPELRRFGEELKEFLETPEVRRLVDRECFGSRYPWETGACGILAFALKRYFRRNASVWGIWGDLPMVEGIGHMAVRVGDDCFLDAHGASTGEELLERWSRKGIDDGDLVAFSREHHQEEVTLSPPTSRKIAEALEERFGPAPVIPPAKKRRRLTSKRIEQEAKALSDFIATADKETIEEVLGNVTCGDIAEYLQRVLGGEVVYYRVEDNPYAKIDPCRRDTPRTRSVHEFLIVDDWIVDWWAAAEGGELYFDLRNPHDRMEVRELYGPATKWIPRSES